jgi:L-malate glycosyltransferase
VGLSPEDRPVRVLWLVKGLGPGGAEHLLLHQAGATDRDRVQPEAAYLLPYKAHLVPQLEALGTPVRCLDGGRDVDLRWALRLRRRLRLDPVDVVHVHSPYVAAVTRLVLRTLPARRRPALVATEHNRWPRHKAATRWANRLTFRLDDHHLAVSADVVATIPARWRPEVEVLVHGVDPAAVRAELAGRDAVRAELGAGPDDVVVGIVANFRAEKAYADLVAAAASATAREPRLRFVSVGQGPLEAEVRAQVAAAGLGERFAVLGYRADAVRVMAGFDVFTLTSRHEGLPVALMDALALGLPVVATSVGGIPEAVADGREGVLVPPGQPDRLADAYVELAGDPARRAAMADAAARAGERFDIRAAAARLDDLYVALARARARPSTSS